MGNFRWLYQIQEHLGIHQWGVLLLCVLYSYIYVYLRDEIAYLCILELIIIHTRLFGASEKLRDKQIRRATNWRIEKNRDRINWINVENNNWIMVNYQRLKMGRSQCLHRTKWDAFFHSPNGKMHGVQWHQWMENSIEVLKICFFLGTCDVFAPLSGRINSRIEGRWINGL